jgi:hypothetical protein
MFSKTIFIAAALALFAGVRGAEPPSVELNRLRAENRRLRQELDRLRASRSKEERDLLKFRAWLAATADSGKVQTASEREMRLLAVLSEMVVRCNRLVVHISSVERTFRDLLSEFPVGPARQARLLLQLEQLERYSMQVSSIAAVAEADEDPAAFRETTVLAVNRELETAVLAVGSVHGVFPGLLYQARNDEGLVLRIVSVRPWVCAAVPVSGGIDKITPGMRFTAEHRARPGERISPLRRR